MPPKFFVVFKLHVPAVTNAIAESITKDEHCSLTMTKKYCVSFWTIEH